MGTSKIVDEQWMGITKGVVPAFCPLPIPSLVLLPHLLSDWCVGVGVCERMYDYG